MKTHDYQIRKETFEIRHLNYWEFWFSFDSLFYEEDGQSEYGYDNFHDLCKDVREDYRTNRELHKDKDINEPLCYYFARYFEWNEKEKCYEYTDYKLTFRKGKIYGKEI